MEFLIEKLQREGVLKTPRIIRAFYKIRREDFLPEELKESAQIDCALPTMHGQTISQPYTVAFMLELLDPREGQKILDVGSGSGWVAAMLAEIVGKKGRVYAVERIADLVEFGRKNAEKYHFRNLTFIHGDGSRGLQEYAPFDRIHVAAAAKIIPRALKEQLKITGKMVIPTQENDIRLVERLSEKRWREERFSGFVFVPLVET